jgi:hypothetical protein
MPKRISKKRDIRPTRPKRPKDVNQWANQMVRESTGGGQQEIKKTEVSRIMSAMGRKGGKISGARRMRNLSPEKRSEIALKAAKGRWQLEKVVQCSNPECEQRFEIVGRRNGNRETRQSVICPNCHYRNEVGWPADSPLFARAIP